VLSVRRKEFVMKVFLSSLVLAGLSAAPGLSWAQAAADQCILAGRVDAQGAWAPQASGVELLDAAGKRVSGGKANMSQVKAVRLAQPTLLSDCNGDKPLPAGGEGVKKQAAPALSAGKEPVPVEAVAYPPLKVGGELVELKVKVPAGRVIALKR
jgi:hypothetical protein